MRSSIQENPGTARYCKYNVEKLQDTVVIRENTDQRNPAFWHKLRILAYITHFGIYYTFRNILRSVYLYKHENIQTSKAFYYYVIYEISDK